ncbi:3'-5' exonuclease [Paracidobacterium acidisoli]|uniref:DNA 3'-5' helicase n=1 Tax=Paracidobacterium acidisoli TaxID=2303751 RepID=A0A372ISN0_9BACT|nr:3'-5' exonuclease [Paracidobacterium acidisoli]MBT9330865.1 UvrD-helicase domain-containing protein [Paracidobacterium acidisoli]
MEFRIADTFTDSLGRLTGDEQKAAKMAAFDLQLNPTHPSMSFHKLDKAKDKNFWSIRVTSDIRLIVHRNDTSLLLCYVAHHDDAYHWAERRRMETHPKTGAAQLVEIRERVQEITVPKYVEEEQVRPKRKALPNISEGTLLNYGVPEEWLSEVLNASEDDLLEIAGHLPAEAAEALLNLATGIRPPLPEPVAPGTNPFEHPDAMRRFRVMKNSEELALALDYPWERWAVFLHPEQRKLVEKKYNGPARASGTAGTGKTIVAIHRAAYLARTHRDARVLLTTFSVPLANALHTKLRLLLTNEPRLGERIEVYSMDAIGRRLYELNIGKLKIATKAQIAELLRQASKDAEEHKFSLRFLTTEWEQVVDGWQLDSWEEYRDVNRLGRKSRLREEQRKLLWTIFEAVRAGLREQRVITAAGMFNVLARHYANGAAPPFDFAVVDEAQDISIAQIRFLASMAGGKPNGLFFAGDLGQRIFQQPFSWKAAGADVRGRATTLKINYRTSHQIRTQADRLLDAQIADVDGNEESRKDAVSLFNGPKPDIKMYASHERESEGVAEWLRQLAKAGLQPHEIALFVRSAEQIDRATKAAELAGIKYRVLDEHVEVAPGVLPVCTMHLAKGLEFRAVGVMACDDEVIPFQERIEAVADESDLEDVYSTERHLLYVACTRARDHLFVTSTEPASEFLEDMAALPN